MKAHIYISPKEGILDPQGMAVLNALKNLGFQTADEVRMGKFIELYLHDEENPENTVRRMCEELLHNPLIESYRFEIVED